MKLEEEIKQKSFKSPYNRMMVNIIFTGNYLHKQLQIKLRPFKISPQQYNVLSILRGQHPSPCSLGEVQSRMLDRMSNATRLVDKLLNKELVVRCQCEANRRKVEITITDAGLTLLKQIEAQVPPFDQWFSNITSEEAATVGLLLDKVRE